MGESGHSVRFNFLRLQNHYWHDCSHGIKRHLLLGRKAMTNLDSVLKSRHHFANKGPSSKSYGFPSSHVWMWELDLWECWRIDAFKLQCWRIFLRVPWTARRSNQSVNPKEINPEYSLEELILKLQYFGHVMQRAKLTPGKRPWCWERLRVRGEEGDRGWDGWMASPIQWTWIWANSGKQWRTG